MWRDIQYWDHNTTMYVYIYIYIIYTHLICTQFRNNIYIYVCTYGIFTSTYRYVVCIYICMSPIRPLGASFKSLPESPGCGPRLLQDAGGASQPGGPAVAAGVAVRALLFRLFKGDIDRA